MKVNFHCHTLWSDGYLSFQEELRLALEQGLLWWVVQDHDRTMAWSKQNIQETCQYIPIESVSRGLLQSGQLKIPQGIELSVNDNGKEIHIGGLFIDHPDDEFARYLKRVARYRWGRIRSMAKAVNVSMRDVIEQVGLGVPCRLHLGYIKYLQEMEKPEGRRNPHIKCARDAMDVYVGQDKLGYVSFDVNFVYTPQVGIDRILQLGGMPVWNHPKRTCKETNLSLEPTYERYNGYAGGKLVMEVEDPKGLEAMLNKYRIVVVGNDFHGYPYDRKDIPLAVNLPNELGTEMVRRLEESHKATTK